MNIKTMESKQILFIESYPTINLYKIAREFKKKGYETILIRLLKPSKINEKFYNNAYDKIISLNIRYFKYDYKNIIKIFFSTIKNMKILSSNFLKILQLNPYVIIGRSTPCWPIAIFRFFYKKTPFIFFPMDLRGLNYTHIDDAMKRGGLTRFEIRCEKYCLEKSDGIIHKNSDDELEIIQGRLYGSLKLPEFTILFHPYCSDEFIAPINKNKLSKKDNEAHIVYVGSGPVSKEIYYNIFNNSSVEDIIAHRIHYHLYIIPNTGEQDKAAKESFFKEYKNIKNLNYFHIHESMDPLKIVKEISRYDFGIFSPFNPDLYPVKDLDYKIGLGNKISTYFEAGIPLFISDKYTSMTNFLKTYGLYIPITTKKCENNINNMNQIIKKINYEKLEKNILTLRKIYNVQAHFDELETFVKKVVKKKRGHD